MKKLLIILLLGAAHCVANQTGQEQTETLTLTTSDSIVRDANGTVLGYVVDFTTYYLTIMSDKGYVYIIRWDGSFSEAAFIYSTNDCSGEIYTYWQQSNYSKEVFYPKRASLQAHLYTFAEPDSNGLTQSFTNGILSSDTWSLNLGSDGSVSCSTYASSQLPVYGAKVRIITREEAGIPESIQAPLTLEFKE